MWWRMRSSTRTPSIVSFCSSIPVFFLGFVAGSFSDIFDKRRVLVVTQAIYAAGAIYLSIATYCHFVTYFQIVFVALVLGVVSTIEMPTRQSLVSRVVPASELATAIPLTATTFNMARIVGPADRKRAARRLRRGGLLPRQRNQLPRPHLDGA